MRLRRIGLTPSSRPPLCRGALVAVGVAVAIGLAACGGDDDEDTTAATTAPSGATGAGGGGGQTLDISATDFKFDPSDPTVKPGTVSFDLTNDGQAPHNIEVEGPSGDEQIPQDVQPGSSGKLTVDLDEPGTYEFFCPVANHKELGMVGKVTVKG